MIGRDSFKFQKSDQLLIRTHNETLSVAAMTRNRRTRERRGFTPIHAPHDGRQTCRHAAVARRDERMRQGCYAVGLLLGGSQEIRPILSVTLGLDYWPPRYTIVRHAYGFEVTTMEADKSLYCNLDSHHYFRLLSARRLWCSKRLVSVWSPRTEFRGIARIGFQVTRKVRPYVCGSGGHR
jgi:hypothetical protein